MEHQRRECKAADIWFAKLSLRFSRMRFCMPDIRRTSKPFVEQACACFAYCWRASARNTPQRNTSCIWNISRDSELPLPAECTPRKLFFGSALLTSLPRKSQSKTRRGCHLFRLRAAVSIHGRLRPSANIVGTSLRWKAASRTWARAGQAWSAARVTEVWGAVREFPCCEHAYGLAAWTWNMDLSSSLSRVRCHFSSLPRGQSVRRPATLPS